SSSVGSRRMSVHKRMYKLRSLRWSVASRYIPIDAIPVDGFPQLDRQLRIVELFRRRQRQPGLNEHLEWLDMWRVLERDHAFPELLLDIRRTVSGHMRPHLSVAQRGGLLLQFLDADVDVVLSLGARRGFFRCIHGRTLHHQQPRDERARAYCVQSAIASTSHARFHWRGGRFVTNPRSRSARFAI